MIALDDNIEDHPKFVSLSDDSFSLWVRCIGYCRRNLTDGFVPAQAAKSRCRGSRTPDDIIGELLAAPVGLPDSAPLWAAVPGGYQIHDYLDKWNPSRASVEASREQKRAAGSRGGKRSGEARGEAKGQAEPKQTRSRTEAECLPSACLSASPLANPDPIRSDPVPDPDPISGSSKLLLLSEGETDATEPEPPPPPARTPDPEPALSVTPDVRRVWQTLKTHEVLQPIATMRLASAIVDLATNHDKLLDWVVVAIGEAAFDAAEAGLNAEALSRKVRGFVKNARPPRETPDFGAAAVPPRDELPARYRKAADLAPLIPTSLESLRAGVDEMRARGVEPHPAMLAHIRKLEAEQAS